MFRSQSPTVAVSKWCAMGCLCLGAPSWHWTPRWCLPHGEPRGRSAVEDGAALSSARRRKARTYPELCGPHSRARLVVLATETGRRWSEEAHSFLSQSAKAE